MVLRPLQAHLMIDLQIAGVTQACRTVLFFSELYLVWWGRRRYLGTGTVIACLQVFGNWINAGAK